MKSLKRITAVLLTLVICLALSGCADVEQMRKEHAVWMDKEQTLIKYNGTEYKLLDFPRSGLMIESDIIANITTADVPLLLSGFTGDTVEVSKDKALISYYGNVLYCRIDKHPFYELMLETNDYTKNMCYAYTDYDTWEDHTYRLSEYEVKIIKEITEDETPLDTNDINYEYCIPLFNYIEDVLLSDYNYEILIASENLYIVNYNGDEVYTYRVPGGYASVINDIAKAYVTAEQYYFDYTYEF